MASQPRAPYRARFWGVRGSTPTPTAENLRYGGNTSCLELELSPSRRLIFDAGTGIRLLGNQLSESASEPEHDIRIFLTHYHHDHIQGLPFFRPLYWPGCRLTFHGHRPPGLTLQETLERIVSPPFFPATLAESASVRRFMEVGIHPIAIDDLTVTPVPLNHPQRATGYRVDGDGRSFLYATDHEPGNAAADAALCAAAKGVGVLIVDAHFTPEEHERHRGWGHSTWRAAAELAREARAGRLILFHHHPHHSDEEMDRIVAAARTVFPTTDAAREGMEFDL